MKNNITTKKAWQKPEVTDLDMNRGTEVKSPSHAEGTFDAPTAS
jgi:hypothetical protein